MIDKSLKIMLTRLAYLTQYLRSHAVSSPASATSLSLCFNHPRLWSLVSSSKVLLVRISIKSAYLRTHLKVTWRSKADAQEFQLPKFQPAVPSLSGPTTTSAFSVRAGACFTSTSIRGEARA